MLRELKLLLVKGIYEKLTADIILNGESFPGNKTRMPTAIHIGLELVAQAMKQEKKNVKASKLQGVKKQSTGSVRSLLKCQWPFFEEVDKLTLRSIYYRIAKGA